MKGKNEVWTSHSPPRKLITPWSWRLILIAAWSVVEKGIYQWGDRLDSLCGISHILI